MAFAAYCRARYLTPDKNGETRADRNAATVADGGAPDPTPEWDIPDEGKHIWQWFEDIEKGFNRVIAGSVRKLTWQDYAAWLSVTQNLVRPHEIAILKAMDLSYCEALEAELQYARATAEDEAKREADMQRRMSGTSRGRR